MRRIHGKAMRTPPTTPLHEPAGTPRGFGVRQSSGAFGSGPRAQKRQRTAAVQDASAPAAASSRFMVPMHSQNRKEALQRAFFAYGSLVAGLWFFFALGREADAAQGEPGQEKPP